MSESEASDTGILVENPLDRTKQVSALYPNYEAMLHQQDERVAEYQVGPCLLPEKLNI